MITFALLSGYFLKVVPRVFEPWGHIQTAFIPTSSSSFPSSHRGQRLNRAVPEVFSDCCRVLAGLGAFGEFFDDTPASLDAVPASLRPSLAVTFLLAERL